MGFKYRLAVDNYSNEPAKLRIYDRLPHGDRQGEIRVTFADPKIPVSADAHYVRTERSKGILRWDVEVPAGANADKPFVVEYNFTIDYDRTFALAPSKTDSQEQQGEFEQLQRSRMLKQ